tara:strand:+ start:46 stop:156 length:111 start_codon:yes stop_codon:yes gene_type:complete
VPQRYRRDEIGAREKTPYNLMAARQNVEKWWLIAVV